MSGNQNHRETGATKYPAKSGADPSDASSQDAAGNKKPKTGVGLTRTADEVDDRTHQSDGENPPGGGRKGIGDELPAPFPQGLRG